MSYVKKPANWQLATPSNIIVILAFGFSMEMLWLEYCHVHIQLLSYNYKMCINMQQILPYKSSTTALGYLKIIITITVAIWRTRIFSKSWIKSKHTVTTTSAMELYYTCYTNQGRKWVMIMIVTWMKCDKSQKWTRINIQQCSIT